MYNKGDTVRVIDRSRDVDVPMELVHTQQLQVIDTIIDNTSESEDAVKYKVRELMTGRVLLIEGKYLKKS